MAENTDAFKIGNFGFFKDSELTMRLSEDNLYDQMKSDGTVDIWFGGTDVWIPDFGVFNIYIDCDQTFFWDILDGDGKRTKTGFEEIQIPYNPNFEAHEGDLIPVNKEEVFDYTFENPSSGDNQLISANLWFYTNLFLDEYYRYNLLLLDVSEGNGWPNEIGVRNTPMNDKLTIHDNEFIMGYRPKIEYMNQLAVLKTLISGPENKILFRLKVDLEFLTENPTAKRTIKVFSQTDDTIRYTLYPRSVDDILWRHNGRKFLNEYQRYLLDYGVMQYIPNDRELDWADRKYEEMMVSSNIVVQADDSYLRDIASDMTRIFNGEELHVAGYTAAIKEHFTEWFDENQKTNIVTTIYEILTRVILTRKYFKGFHLLAAEMNREVDIPGEPESPHLIVDPVGPTITIVKQDGVAGYTNGYIPHSALEYINPKPGYAYEGDIGSGFYKILIAERECHIFCDMVTDGGGWMVIIAGHATTPEYMSNFGDTYFIKNKMYTDEGYGLGWTNENTDLLVFQMYNSPFNQVKAIITGEHDNPEGSTGTLEFYTASAGAIISLVDNGTQRLVVDGVVIQDNVSSTIENMEVLSNQGTGDMNSLTIKIGRINEGYLARRFISELKIR
jgi:hypothetical protein